MAAPLLQIVLLSLLLFPPAVVFSVAQEAFDVRRHLSTGTRYDLARDTSGSSPIHLNLVARHGTRAPTKKKMKELEALSVRLEMLLDSVKEQKPADIPGWLRGWKSPWTGKHKGGELITEGEAEMFELGIRTRERFPELFNQDYHPDIYPIKATQVSRASASAVAFGMGL